MAISVHLRCPSCQGELATTQRRCEACDLTLSGKFPTNEFASLGEEDLHFLRIFVLTEGRIRDMESALGVSYPTIKSRMAHMKATLAAHAAGKTEAVEDVTDGAAGGSNQEGATGANGGGEPATVKILQDLQANRLTFEQAMAKLKELR